MKDIIKGALAVVLLNVFVSCDKNELILLENIPMFQNDESQRPIARPEGVMVEGYLNRKIRVVWPSISSNITSAKVRFIKDADVTELVVTEFNSDVEFQADELGEYQVEIMYINKDGSQSNVRTLTVSPGDFEVDIIGQEMQAVPVSGGITFSFKKYLMNNYIYTIKYSIEGEDFVEEFTSESDTVDVYTISGINDDLKAYDFDISIKDVTLDIESQVYRKTLSPWPLAYMVIDRMIGVVNWFDGALLSWSNPTGSAAKVVVKYTENGVNKVREKITSSATDTMMVFGITTQASMIEYHVESLEGIQTSIKSFNVTPSILTNFNTKPLKADAGWQVAVSSNHVGDGGGAPALIDGSIGTYWHTPWNNSAIAFPHHATFTFPVYYKVTKFSIVNRDHPTPNSVGKISLQVSDNGTDFRTVQQFTNTNNSRGALTEYTLNTPVISKYIRLLFETSLSNNYFMNLSEINFTGYKEN